MKTRKTKDLELVLIAAAVAAGVLRLKVRRRWEVVVHLIIANLGIQPLLVPRSLNPHLPSHLELLVVHSTPLLVLFETVVRGEIYRKVVVVARLNSSSNR